MSNMQGNTAPDYVTIGFEKIDRDLHFLIGCLGETLVELGHHDLAAYLPWSAQPLPDAESGAFPAQLGLVYSIAFQLLNMVEENAAASMRALREMHEGVVAERGLWGNQLARLMELGLDPRDVAARLGGIRVEPVLTAHPTEAKRLSVLDQHRAIFALLEARDRRDMTPTESESLRLKTKAAMERLWRTGEILLEKPTLTDERRNVMHYLREVFPRVLPELDERLCLAWRSAGLDPALLSGAPLPQVRFGTWVGGDRDGHPGVTAEVTEETLRRLRVNALVVQHRALTTLAEKLSLSSWIQPPPAVLVEATQKLAEVLGAEGAAIAATNKGEPWRQFVELMIARTPLAVVPQQLAQEREGPGRYQHAAELAADLETLHASLVEIGAQRLAESDVRTVQRSVEIFGFHLGQLDIRQNSVFHAKALAQLMTAAGIDGSQWEDWSETERLRFLAKELGSPRPFLHASASAGPEADTVLGCYRVIAAHLARRGPDGVGALIVSMTRRLSDLLAVYVLAREAGLTRMLPEGMVCVLPVVPLFETGDDLEAAPSILGAFLEDPMTRRSLDFLAWNDGRQRLPLTQQVMVGYSDSNKDAGIIASQWALQKAQANLAQLGRDTGVAIRFFHGRGGTISRGAGPTHRFLDALPAGSLCGDIRLTEQGETIAQKFGNLSTAAYNLELLVAGVAATTLRHHGKSPMADGKVQMADGKASAAGGSARGIEAASAGAQVAGGKSPMVEGKPDSGGGGSPKAATAVPVSAPTLPSAIDHLPYPTVLLERLAASSRAAYRALLEADGFMTFHRQATPIDALEHSRIGSRPSRRTGQASLADLRAIPWVFSWTQARFYLPGWYGAGSALASLSDAECAELSGYLRSWPFLHYMLTNIESSLASSDHDLMRAYASLVEDEQVRTSIFERIEGEWSLTKRMLEKLRGSAMADRRPRMSKTLALRAEALRVLHLQEIALLRRWRALYKAGDDAAADALLPELLLSINAIASGLRTTG